MDEQRTAELIKKVVGKKGPADIWDRLYQLNTFASKLTQSSSSGDDAYPVRKVVGKPRPGRR